MSIRWEIIITKEIEPSWYFIKITILCMPPSVSVGELTMLDEHYQICGENWAAPQHPISERDSRGTRRGLIQVLFSLFTFNTQINECYATLSIIDIWISDHVWNWMGAADKIIWLSKDVKFGFTLLQYD